MANRVFVIAAEYSAHPRHLRTEEGALRDYEDYTPESTEQVFFKHPRTREGWSALGRTEPVDLGDLLASAGHRALCALHDSLASPDYSATLKSVTDLWATTMPGIATQQTISPALIPQMLRAQLRLPFDSRCQFVVGTSDSGAWAFANAVRAARQTRATVLLTAGQIIPSGYSAVQRIRTVLGKPDQAAGLDMLAIGDLLLDNVRRTQSRMSRAEIIASLDEIRRRKYAAARGYPSAMMSAAAPDRGGLITPFYRVPDIAPACCGAAAVVLTSDEGLVARIKQNAGSRFGRPPIVEVVGVGEGTSNPTLLHRRSPLTFGQPVIQSLTSAAEDAQLDMDIFERCSFAVLHDAFPSIELMFLLSMGLDVNQSLQRMKEAWPNPYGGLCVFGHALGASGLVQICKAHHIFSKDSRYVAADSGVSAEPGQLAFTTSVGGPLSHIVVSLFKGGTEEMDARKTLTLRMERPKLVAAQQERRRAIREAAAEYRQALSDGTPLNYVEGVTRVDLRSVLPVIERSELDAVSFAGLKDILLPDHLAAGRESLLERLSLLGRDIARGRANSGTDYDEAISDLAARWKSQDALQPGLLTSDEAQTLRALTRAIKATLTVPVAMLAIRPRGARKKAPAARQVSVLDDFERFAEADFVTRGPKGTAPAEAEPVVLPWWHIRHESPTE
ncbi:MAG: hypothetical protein ACI9WU_001152 [Myxococcota bacterium]|jgi:hypothetical protein